MPPTSSGSAIYYIVLNGAPNGPHRPATVLQLLQEGSIQPDTLICRDGGAAWEPVSEVEAALRNEATPAPMPVQPPPVAPPVAPALPALTMPIGSGYGTGVSGRKPSPHYVPVAAPPVSRVLADVTKPFRFLTLLGALALFFLPWVECRCAGMNSVRQSGVQTMLGNCTIAADTPSTPSTPGKTGLEQYFSQEQLAGLKDDQRTGSQPLSGLDYAWFAGGALFFMIIGLGIALAPGGRNPAGVMALLALMCLGMQMFAGFPLLNGVEKQVKETFKGSDLTEDQAKVARKKLEEKNVFAAGYTPWFYAELGLLGLTAVIGLTGGTKR